MTVEQYANWRLLEDGTMETLQSMRTFVQIWRATYGDAGAGFTRSEWDTRFESLMGETL